MGHGWDLQIAQQLRKHSIVQGTTGLGRKDQRQTGEMGTRLLQHAKRRAGQRNTMLHTDLHPLGGNRPRRRREIELRPGGSAHLAGTCSGKDQQLECEARSRIAGHRTQTRKRATDVGVRQSSVVDGRSRHPGKH